MGNCPLFLSCLYGSEHSKTQTNEDAKFLSCLYGSEPPGSAGTVDVDFLSCLYGSEPLLKQEITLI
ncbi:hypothetical protein F900_01639 [Acinetobacter modestus]|uniref:Uncharacterized protein n=1 Tax=Acinetobacter modestus TaxID=1776740 RepID=N9LYD1_9GAMM|nr:hypothetical protein F900_01639 [Acinetobacter modestus]